MHKSIEWDQRHRLAKGDVVEHSEPGRRYVGVVIELKLNREVAVLYMSYDPAARNPVARTAYRIEHEDYWTHLADTSKLNLVCDVVRVEQ